MDMQIHDILGNIYSMPEDSVQKLVAKMKKLSFVKGDRILQAGKVERNIFFVEKGIVRAYLPLDGKDVTFWIGMEGAMVVSLKRQPYLLQCIPLEHLASYLGITPVSLSRIRAAVAGKR